MVEPFGREARERLALGAAFRLVAGEQRLAQAEDRDAHLAEQRLRLRMAVIMDLGAADRPIGTRRRQPIRGSFAEQPVERRMMAGERDGAGLGELLHAPIMARYG